MRSSESRRFKHPTQTEPFWVGSIYFILEFSNRVCVVLSWIAATDADAIAASSASVADVVADAVMLLRHVGVVVAYQRFDPVQHTHSVPQIRMAAWKMLFAVRYIMCVRVNVCVNRPVRAFEMNTMFEAIL